MTGISVLLAMTLLTIVVATVQWKIRPIGYLPIIGLALVVAAFKLQAFEPLAAHWLVLALGLSGVAVTAASLARRVWHAKRADPRLSSALASVLMFAFIGIGNFLFPRNQLGIFMFWLVLAIVLTIAMNVATFVMKRRKASLPPARSA